MKGVKKCGLLLVLFIIFGLSLNVSLNVSALKYSVDTLPFYSYYLSSGMGFQMTVSDDVNPTSMYSQYIIDYDLEDDLCEAQSFTHLPVVNQNSSLNQYTINYSFKGFFDKPFDSDDSCDSVNSLSNINESSINNFPLDLRQQFKDMMPYREVSSGIFRQDSYANPESGLNYSNKFDLQNVFGSQGYPNKISRLVIPLGAPNSHVRSSLSARQSIEFSGEILIDFDDPTSLGLSDLTVLSLNSVYTPSSGLAQSIGSSCTFTFNRDDVSDPTSIYSLKYSCPTTIWSGYSSHYLPEFYLILNFNYLDEKTKFFQFIFESSFIITDNDDTDGGIWGNDIVGSDPGSAPGSATQNSYGDISSDGVNWTKSLTNLFQFNFINPFAPLFQLFTDNSSCASIPTIAGLIHSEETQVCPWFDSTVRNIVTPVLGLSSMMLVFGFAVRWLGSSSGNMFEDSGSIEPPGYSASGGTAIKHGWRRKK